MDNLKGKKVLIFQQRGWTMRIGHSLAKHLQKGGCSLAAFTIKKTTHKFVAEQKEVKYDRIINIDEIFEDPKNSLGETNITLDEICNELGVDSVWPMLHSNRLFTRTYGEKFYYGFKQNVPDEFITDYIKAYYVACKELFDKFKPDVIFVAAFVYEGHIILNLFANKYNIPIVSLTDSKIPGYQAFTYDYLDRKGPLVDRFYEINKGGQSNNLEKATKYIDEFRKEFKKPSYAVDTKKKVKLIKRIRQELFPYKQVFEWYFKKGNLDNYIKSVGPTEDYRPPKIILRDHYAKKKYIKSANKFNYHDFEKIEKFVYFPLQFTPEGSADLTCPLYSNQLELARQIAMSLPGDYTLVAKEHPAMVGLRTPSIYEKISRIPNVKLIDYRISSEKVLEKADLIIGTYGTTLVEAAFYSKGAIMLSKAGIFDLLPNIFQHSDVSTISTKIKEVLSKDLKTKEYEDQLRNFVAAVFDVGFTINYRRMWFGDGKESLDPIINTLTEGISNSLKQE